MAFINVEKKREIMEKVKPVLKKYGVSGTASIRNHSTFVLTLRKGTLDLVADADLEWIPVSKDELRQRAWDVNPYHYDRTFKGKTRAFMDELFTAIKTAGAWYDKSDIMVDYFDTAFYIDVQLGTWAKGPYVVVNN